MKTIPNRKGHFTGRTIKLPSGEFKIGNIVGWNGRGIPVYQTLDIISKKQVGEISNEFIHKARREKRLR